MTLTSVHGLESLCELLPLVAALFVYLVVEMLLLLPDITDRRISSLILYALSAIKPSGLVPCDSG